MERRIQLWELVIKAIATISEHSKYKEVGMKQIFSYIKGFSCPFTHSIDISTIKLEEIFLALTENSDSVELFQFESATKDDIYFSLRDSPERSIQKANKMQCYGINKILHRTNELQPKKNSTRLNENDECNKSAFIAQLNSSYY